MEHSSVFFEDFEPEDTIRLGLGRENLFTFFVDDRLLCSTWPSLAPATVSLVLLERSFESLTVAVLLESLAMRFIVLPSSDVLGISFLEVTLAVSPAIQPLAFVPCSVSPDGGPLAIGPSVLELSDVGSVWILGTALSVEHIILEIAFENCSIRFLSHSFSVRLPVPDLASVVSPGPLESSLADALPVERRPGVNCPVWVV
eukprot:CAMPEP_0170509692 /NCGR_PEP_ID=MMETSP0208-20121228/65356_1 /TAXON_ID=197538 /ORGANISM="Strombidium inclinatum, Strain S3" /LENGTH=200 /DNA_ID=CAMNT_0010793075 /DNA_START=40 /DNA_END=638 /DNA_ORIENTATION=+